MFPRCFPDVSFINSSRERFLTLSSGTTLHCMDGPFAMGLPQTMGLACEVATGRGITLECMVEGLLGANVTSFEFKSGTKVSLC